MEPLQESSPSIVASDATPKSENIKSEEANKSKKMDNETSCEQKDESGNDTQTDDRNPSAEKDTSKTEKSEVPPAGDTESSNIAESVPTQQKKEQASSSHSQKKRRGGNGSRSGRGRRQSGKRGEWKKLDVEVSFNKNTQAGGGRRGGRGHADHKKNANKPEPSSTQNSKPSHPPKNSNYHNQHRRKNGGGGRGGHGRSGDTPDSNLNWRERKDKKYNKHHGSVIYSFPELTEEQLKAATTKAVAQVEFFFGNDELCRNTFLRNHMDTEGYLPAAIVFNFPSVVKLSVPYDVLLNAVSSSEALEVDFANETLRLRHNFEKWLFPNGEGGFGCPRWIKQPTEEVAVENVEKELSQDASVIESKKEEEESAINDNKAGDEKKNDESKKEGTENKENDASGTPELCETDGESM